MNFLPLDQLADTEPTDFHVEWEESPCLLCGGRNWFTLVEAPDATPGGSGLWFAVVQCQDCGLCFTNPRPTEASIGQFYPAGYAPHQTRTAPRKRQRGDAERLALPRQGQGRLLDFGCGGGSYLKRMHGQGWKVLGLDASPAAVASIREELSLDALVGTLPHPDLVPRSFDVITMWHSLEHVHQPQEVLAEAKRLLTPGGKLIIAVPNIDSLPFRWFGHAWFGLDLPRHLTHFAPWTLQLMLERVGFKVEPIRMVRHSSWLRSSAKRARRSKESPQWHRLITTGPGSRLATWYSYWTKQADCMIVTARR